MSSRGREDAAAGFCGKVYRFYREGFRSMGLGRTLWKLILIKVFILFAVIKFFFFPDILKTRFATNRERADHVLETLTGGQQAQPQAETRIRRQP